MAVSPPNPLPLPDRYEVLEVLVEDEVEVLYRCRDRTLGREVLVKRPGEALARIPCSRLDDSRALREARSLAQVTHPGIQRLLDVIESPEGPLLVLEPAAGESLAERLAREESLTPEEVTRLGIELADALAAVHAIGAVHRDLSPEHVVLRTDGTACLTGFRLVKFTAQSGEMSSIAYISSRTGRAPEGTPRRLLPAYPAPEQFGGEVANPRTDLFGLGCLLYRCLTGVDAIPDLLDHGWHPPKDPGRLVPEAPKALTKAILGCLSRSPVGRSQSAADLRDTLQAALPRESTGGRRPLGWPVVAGLATAAVAAAIFIPRSGVLGGFRGVVPQDPDSPGPGMALARGGEYEAGFKRSVALLIGIQDYHGFEDLPNAESDAKAFASRLEQLPRKWETTLLLGKKATRTGIITALEDLRLELTPEDRALVFFAGHGVPLEDSADANSDTGWIIPSDGKPLQADARWIKFSEFRDFMDACYAKHILVTMDCCYGGRLASTTRQATTRRFEERYLTRKARVIICSGRGDEPVLDGSEHSPFTAALLESLDNPDAVAITSSRLFSDILGRFEDLGISQTPTHAPGASGGQFVFFLK